jgi:hypothetical protein
VPRPGAGCTGTSEAPSNILTILLGALGAIGFRVGGGAET